MNFKDDNSNNNGKNLNLTPDNSKILAPAQVQILKQQSERITQLEQKVSSLEEEISRKEARIKDLTEQTISREGLSNLAGQLNETISKAMILNDKKLSELSQRIQNGCTSAINEIHMPHFPRPPFWWYMQKFVFICLIMFPSFMAYATIKISQIKGEASAIPTMQEQISRTQWNVTFPDDRVGLTTPFQKKWDNQWNYELNEQKKAAETQKE